MKGCRKRGKYSLSRRMNSFRKEKCEDYTTCNAYLQRDTKGINYPTTEKIYTHFIKLVLESPPVDISWFEKILLSSHFHNSLSYYYNQLTISLSLSLMVYSSTPLTKYIMLSQIFSLILEKKKPVMITFF